MKIYFLAADVFLAADLALGAAAFLGFGAFGFLVGGLALFFAFGAALLGFAAGFLAAAGFFLAAAAFLSLIAALGLAAAADFFLGDAADLGFLGDLLAADFGLAADEDDGFLAVAFFDSNLNEPDAPLPLVWMSAPDSTALFRYFLMKGANFSASTLYVAAMYFLIAWSDDPLRSFISLMALFTISDVLGWVGFALGFFAAADLVFFAGVAGAGLSDATAASAIVV